jgi:hypothetical protein
MKGYYLSPISSRSIAIEKLNPLLPDQLEPWLLTDTTGDAIAYFNIDDNDQRRPPFTGRQRVRVLFGFDIANYSAVTQSSRPRGTKAFIIGVFSDKLRSRSITREVKPASDFVLKKIRCTCHRKSGWRVNADRV